MSGIVPANYHFEKEKGKLLVDPAILTEWLAYQSSFPYVSAYYRAAPQFAHQSSTVNGKKTGSDLNLYKLFLEQSYRLLRDGGHSGVIIPTGVYTDLGAKGLREMLFDKTRLGAIYAMSNERYLFEGVDHRFKFAVLNFTKGQSTDEFQAAFRFDPRVAISKEKLRDFLHDPNQHVSISLELVRRLSPDSLSVMEFKSELDAHIAEKMLRFPLLGEQLDGVWNLKLSTEFHMTNDSHLFHTQPAPGRLPLYEGKMIHQFRSDFGTPKYWLDESGASTVLSDLRLRGIARDLKKQNLSIAVTPDDLQLDYNCYRVAFRDVAASTNERTFIATVLPPKVFCPHTMSLETVHIDEVVGGQLHLNVSGMTDQSRLFVTSIFNSFAVDYLIRQRVTAHVSFFFVYGLPVPRLTPADPSFQPIVAAAAKLICTTPEFDDLAQVAGLQGHTDGVTDDAGRAALRAELDARVAHLYGLSESEFTHILGAFPLVDQVVKDAALAEFRRLAPPEGDPALVALVQRGESGQLEFKSSLRVPVNGDAPSKELTAILESVVLKEVAAFLNGEGGTLLIGVSDDGRGLGLDPDFASFSKEKERNADGFERHLRGLVGNALGHPTAAKLKVTFPVLDGQVICRVDVPQGDEEAFLEVADKGGQKRHVFYIRVGNKVEELPAGPKQTGYIKQEFPLSC